MKSLTALILALCALTAHAQWRYIGTGEAMRPALNRGEMLFVWTAPYAELKAGNVVATRFENNWTIATRLVSYSPGEGWLTRADGNTEPDVARLTEDNYVGLVTIDIYTPRQPQPRISGPETKDLYILCPYIEPIAPATSGYAGYMGANWPPIIGCPDVPHGNPCVYIDCPIDPLCPHVCIDLPVDPDSPVACPPIVPPENPNPPVTQPPTSKVPDGPVFGLFAATLAAMILARKRAFWA